MGEWFALAGGALLAVATVPQAVRLFRTRSVQEFTWPFVAMNFVGISLLALRSVELREAGFVAANGVASAFWLFVGVLKARA